MSQGSYTLVLRATHRWSGFITNRMCSSCVHLQRSYVSSYLGAVRGVGRSDQTGLRGHAESVGLFATSRFLSTRLSIRRRSRRLMRFEERVKLRSARFLSGWSSASTNAAAPLVAIRFSAKPSEDREPVRVQHERASAAAPASPMPELDRSSARSFAAPSCASALASACAPWFPTAAPRRESLESRKLGPARSRAAAIFMMARHPVVVPEKSSVVGQTAAPLEIATAASHALGCRAGLEARPGSAAFDVGSASAAGGAASAREHTGGVSDSNGPVASASDSADGAASAREDRSAFARGLLFASNQEREVRA